MTTIPSDRFCLCENTEDVNASLAFLIEDDWMRQAAAQNDNGPLTAQDDAAGGCDGFKDGLASFHTQKQQDPWWQVDLGSVVPLGRIVIWNRTNDPNAVRCEPSGWSCGYPPTARRGKKSTGMTARLSTASRAASR